MATSDEHSGKTRPALQEPGASAGAHDPCSNTVPPANGSRRLLIKAAFSFPVLGWFGERAWGATVNSDSSRAEPKRAAWPLFFTDAERAFTDAATECLIPDGDDGLGARSAGVTFFIDSQLAGPFGKAETWYMKGPWADGTKQQGYQSRLSPAAMYRAAIADIDAHCRSTYDGKTFAAIAPADQDQVLHGLENGDIKLPGLAADETSAKDFFDLLWKNTKEGFLSDPMYGGNRNFAGWRLIGFPGPRYNYLTEITAYGKPYALPPVGLLGRNGLLIQPYGS